VMANSPAVLEAYLAFSGALSHGALEMRNSEKESLSKLGNRTRASIACPLTRRLARRPVCPTLKYNRLGTRERVP
jgi:hypothetical protein